MTKGVLRLVLLLSLLSACAPATLPAPPTPTPEIIPTVTLRWTYPETYTPLVAALAQAYQRAYPTQRLVLVPRAETLAWDALTKGEADIAWVMGVPEETTAWTQLLAWDGLAIIVHPFNGVPGFTLDDARRLFTGQVDRWTLLNGPEGTPQVVTREEAAGEARALQRLALGGNRVTLTALLAPSTDLMLEMVASDPMAVGYVVQSRLTADVRAVAVEGVPPRAETIAEGVYPLRVEVWLAASSVPETGALADFVSWLRGPEARALLTAYGVIPVP